MKNYISLLLILFVGFVSVAQDDMQSEKAKGILDKVSVKTKGYKTIKGVFQFKMESLQDEITEEYKGTIKVKGEKYKLELMGTVTYFDGATQWTWLKDAEEVNIIDPAEDEEEFINPAKFLTIYEEGFKYKFVKEVFEDSYPLYIIDLFPIESGKKEYSRIRLKIIKGKDQIYSVKYFGKEGNHYIITVLKLETAGDISDSEFIFDPAKHPEVEVIDMRE